LLLIVAVDLKKIRKYLPAFFASPLFHNSSKLAETEIVPKRLKKFGD